MKQITLVDSRHPLEKALESLVLKDRDFSEIARSLDVFCPFEAVGMVRAEIRHSAYLTYVMDPLRPHGFGDELLRRFLIEAASEGSSDISSLDLHLATLGRADVRREWERLDLLVVSRESKFVAAVEMKIDAVQSLGQLRKYRELVERTWPRSQGWRHLFVFLTREEEEPDDETWVAMRMPRLVSIIESFLSDRTFTDQSTVFLSSYASMLKRHHMKDERLERLSQSIWSRHGEALDFLMKTRPNPAGAVFQEVQRIADAETPELRILSGDHELTLARDDDGTGTLRFYVPEWGRYPQMKTGTLTTSNHVLLFQISRNGDQFSANLYVITSDDSVTRESVVNALQTMRRRRSNDRKWTQILTQSLLTWDGEDIESAARTIWDGFVGFARRTSPDVDTALSVLD